MSTVRDRAVRAVYRAGWRLAGSVPAPLLGGPLAVGAAIIARKGAAEGRKTAIPFGPYLALGGLVALFAGGPIVDWYLSTFA